MEEIKNGEQPEVALAENSCVEKFENSQNEMQSGSPTRKFKNLDALLKAYTDLEKEFTKKCQKIKELSDSLENCTSEKKAPQYKRENWHNEVANFFETNPSAIEFADEISSVLENDKVIASSDNSLLLALTKVKADKFRPDEEIIKDEQFLNKYVLSNPLVKEKIIENYLSGILSNHSAPLISNESGVFTSAPKEKPKTLQEARKIAEALFKI